MTEVLYEAASIKNSQDKVSGCVLHIQPSSLVYCHIISEIEDRTFKQEQLSKETQQYVFVHAHKYNPAVLLLCLAHQHLHSKEAPVWL